MPAQTDTQQIKRAMRRSLRSRRRALSKHAQAKAAHALAKNLPSSVRWRGSAVSIYHAQDGEIGTSEIILALQHAKKAVYLPFVDPNGRMRFILYKHRKRAPGKSLVKGRWGILHPSARNGRFACNSLLRVVFLPLVAFDSTGKRLGRGGGFYDKLLTRPADHRKIIGLAHHFQQVDSVPINDWDQPLHAVISDRSTFHF